MKTSVFKLKLIQRKSILLLGSLALLGSFAGNAMAIDCNAKIAHLERLKERGKAEDRETNCSASSKLEENRKHGEKEANGACEAGYKAGWEALDDIIRKKRANCKNVDAVKDNAQAKGCGAGDGGTRADKCQDANGQVAGSGAKAASDEKVAANNLSKWMDKKEKKAEQAKKEIAAKKSSSSSGGGQSSGALSGVSEAIIKAAQQELDDSKEYASEVKKALKQAAQESAAAEKELKQIAKKSESKGSDMKSVPTENNSGKSETAQGKPQEQGQGGASGGGAPSMPSPPGGAGGENGGASGLSETAVASNEDQESLASKSSPLLNSSTGASKDRLPMDTNKKPEDTTAVADSGGSLISSGASSIDTSLRDSLKKKLLGEQAEGGAGEALGGMPFGGGGTGSSKKPGEAGSTGGYLSPLSMPSDSGGGGDSGDFSMARSETDEAVGNLLNEFGQAGTDAALGQDGRSLADIESGPSGIEGEEGTILFSRVHGTIVRYLKKGRVVNGVNGKI